MSQKSGFLIVSNGFFIENVGHTLTKNYDGTYWPLLLPLRGYHQGVSVRRLCTRRLVPVSGPSEDVHLNPQGNAIRPKPGSGNPVQPSQAPNSLIRVQSS